ncbi:MAG: biotin/lipoyl-binding protein [Planctomycetes bacterium]|nr:biotin/lipoyl-binding protein [Planctomycetota bacterium]
MTAAAASPSSAAPPTASPAPPSLASRLRSVRVGTRQDLEVSRHVFRGTPAYVVRDPITFDSQRLSAADYEVFCRIDASRTLGEIFTELVRRGSAAPEDEEPFYRFVMNLHGLGFLHLPIADEKLLYRRYRLKERSRRRQKLLGILFLRIPLWDPSAFLERTVRYARPLFTRTAFVAWLALMAAAAFVVVRRWHDLAQPLQGLLAARNLAAMWLTLIGLKIFHEFGHAYACKHYGGHVPEMGVYLILFTPCAYMDATASWGFTRKLHRIIVCLAGMYVESIIAALAVFAWAATGPSPLNSLAYNVIFLASAVTVLFNINPLMRYDGYYILSDLTEVPNLRARSSRHLLTMAKRRLLGLVDGEERPPRRLAALLLGYGVAAAIYRVSLLLAIAALLASKMFLVGAGLALLYLGGAMISAVRRLMTYLWHSPETVPVRRRAVALGIVALGAIPAALVLVPLPRHVYARGVVAAERETTVRTREPGLARRLALTWNQRVEAGQVLAELDGDEPLERIAQAQAQVRFAETRRDALRPVDAAQALQEEERLIAYRQALEEGRRRLERLNIRAPAGGRVVSCIRPSQTGMYLNEGAPIATLAAGHWRVRAILPEEAFVAAAPRVGQTVEFRAAGTAGHAHSGRIAEILPAGSRIVALPALTQLGGGRIAVTPEGYEAAEPYFEVVVDLGVDCSADDEPAGGSAAGCLRYGMTGTVRLAGPAEPLAAGALRRVHRFVNRLRQE